MTETVADRVPLGTLLREWRRRRRLSQLDLALEAGVSARHLSFLETGRSRPSREMVLQLAEQLDVPLRDRNQLLLAAGFAPASGERGIDLFTAGAAPELLEPPVNVLRLALHPDGAARRILNLGEFRAHLLDRLRRHVALTADERLAALSEEVAGYPAPEPDHGATGGAEIVVPLRLRAPGGGGELRLFSTIATFGTALDVTVAELAIEAFFPADAETAAALRERAP
jgi:transcriptional regulator with XRE-family HTH domain